MIILISIVIILIAFILGFLTGVNFRLTQDIEVIEGTQRNDKTNNK